MGVSLGSVASGFRSGILLSLHFLQLSMALFSIPHDLAHYLHFQACFVHTFQPIRHFPNGPVTLPNAENELILGSCSKANEGTSCSMFAKLDREGSEQKIRVTKVSPWYPPAPQLPPLPMTHPQTPATTSASHFLEYKTKPNFLSQIATLAKSRNIVSCLLKNKTTTTTLTSIVDTPC